MVAEQQQGTIVVGVDGSDHADRALAWAIDEARRLGHRLVLLHAYDVRTAGVIPYGAHVYEALQEAGEEVLAEAAEVARQRGVPAETRLTAGSPAAALVEASRDADLLVVGSRGLGGLAGMLLGSVSSACVHHSHCPVVVVRPAERRASSHAA